MNSGISVVIPSWNGLHLLKENLPSVLAAAQRYQQEKAAPVQVLVVDDGGSDDTVAELKQHFPDVKLVVREQNGGFARACNSGFESCSMPHVALLNNDVQVEVDYLLKIVRGFHKEDVFAVTAKVFEFSPPLFATGGKVALFRRGFWAVYTNYDVHERAVAADELISGYAVGGFACYDRRKLEQLGGFIELLSPFHWEDVDLSYRAWKRGWKVVYEPGARAFHHISATINAHYSKQKVESAAIRNRILFHWINLHTPSFFLAHCWMLLLKVLSRIWVWDLVFYRALFSALRAIPQVAPLRSRERKSAIRSDRELDLLFRQSWKSPDLTIYHDRKEVQKLHPEAQAIGIGSDSPPPLER